MEFTFLFTGAMFPVTTKKKIFPHPPIHRVEPSVPYQINLPVTLCSHI